MRYQEDCLLLHRGLVSGGASGQGLHVGIGEAGHLQVLFGLQNVGKSSDQTNVRLCLKQHNARKHSQLRVEGFVHEQLHDHILDLFLGKRNKETQTWNLLQMSAEVSPVTQTYY